MSIARIFSVKPSAARVGGECRTSIAVDLSSVGAAPFEEFVGVYDELYDLVTRALVQLQSRFGATKPVMEVRLEVWVD